MPAVSLARQDQSHPVGAGLVSAIPGVFDGHLVALFAEILHETPDGWTPAMAICALLVIASIVCFSVTWPISWPSTVASSASFWISASAPRVMWICAGRRKRIHAVCVEHDEGPLQCRPAARRRQHRSDQRDVLVDVSVLHDPVLLAQLCADVGAELPLFRVGEVHVGHFVSGLPQLVELGNCSVTGVASSSAATSIVFVMVLHLVNHHALVASLHFHLADQARLDRGREPVLRGLADQDTRAVLLLSDSILDPRFTASPMTV